MAVGNRVSAPWPVLPLGSGLSGSWLCGSSALVDVQCCHAMFAGVTFESDADAAPGATGLCGMRIILMLCRASFGGNE